MKKKLIIAILFVILLIVVVVGFTYAIYTWSFSETVSGATECFNVNYVKGRDIGSDNQHRLFMPSNDYTGGLSATVMVKMDSNCIINGVGTLFLETVDSTSEILLTSGALKYQVLENSLPIDSGVISSTGTVAISTNLEITDVDKLYTVFVWIDGSLITENNINEILSSSYIGTISMQVESGDLR